MDFDEYKQKIIDKVKVQDFEYKSTGGWINHDKRVPEILIGLNKSQEKTIKIPAHAYNKSREFVSVNGVEEGVLGKNSKMVNLIFANDFPLVIKSKTFFGCKNIQTLVLPKNIKSIPVDASKIAKN